MSSPSIQDMLAELLGALGFAAMARDVRTEHDQQRLRHYARIVLRNSPDAHKRALHSRFALLRLV